MAPLLEVEHLAVAYGDVQVVWDVSLKVEDGAIVALIGSNGAGKTTLLRALSGLLAPKSGSIVFAGENVAGSDAPAMVKRGLIHVPEGRRLFAGMSVRDNLLVGAYHQANRKVMADDIERVFTLFPRLRERQHQNAATLSGGEQQMCAIGRGLMARPKLLMIDELSLGLAPKVVDELVEALVKINAEGTSLLVVEQDVATALDFANHAYVIDQGRTTGSGPSATLASDPAIKAAYLGVI